MLVGNPQHISVSKPSVKWLWHRWSLFLMGILFGAAAMIPFGFHRGKLIQPGPTSTPVPSSAQYSAISLTVSDLLVKGGDLGFANEGLLRAEVTQRTQYLKLAETLEPWEVFINPDPSLWRYSNMTDEPALVCRHPDGLGNFVVKFDETWEIIPERWLEAPWIGEAIRPE